MSNSNCILCNQTLKFTNKSPLGMGKLKDGGEICNDCMKPIRKLGYQSVKKVTLKEVKDGLPRKGMGRFSPDGLKELGSKVAASGVLGQTAQDLGEQTMDKMKDKEKEIEHETSEIAEMEDLIKTIPDSSLQELHSRLEEGIIFYPITTVSSRKLIVYNDRVATELKKSRSITAKFGSITGEEDRVEVFYVDITSIAFREAKSEMKGRGYLSIVAAGVTKKDSSWLSGKSTGSDAYTVYFPPGDNTKFKTAKGLLDKLLRETKKPSQIIVEKQDSDIPGQIKKLSDLKDQGILTDEEFEAKKKDLLDKM